MGRRYGIAVVMVWGWCCGLVVAPQVVAAGKPNIVHIMIDDLGWQDVACYYRAQHGEEPFYETPHLDRLAQRGIRFMRAYSPAVTCAPSRAAFMTGQFTPHNGVYHVNMGGRIPRARSDDRPQLDPYYVGRIIPGKPVIAKALKTAGYTTAHVGKWHISGAAGFPTPIQQGFDFSYDEHHHYNDPELYDPNDPRIANFSGLFAQPKNRLTDAFDDPRFPLLEDERPYDSMVDLSQRWIAKVAKKDEPFFLNLCPNLVHGPVMTRDKKRLAHYCKKLGIPFPTDPGSISDPKTPGQHNPYYASMVDSADWIVGQIVKTLEATDDPRNPGHRLIDNSYVIVSADNGASQNLGNWRSLDKKLRREKVSDNAPLREGKGWAYEGGCRIPFIAMGPGIQAGSVNTETPINLIDLFPTFMAMAGLPHDGTLDLDGCNILPVLTGQSRAAEFHDGTERDMLYLHYPVLNGAFSTVQRDGWKLLKNTGIHMNKAPEIQLFNLNADLSESQNQAAQHPELTKQLLADLNRWLEQYDAGVPYNNGAYKKGNLPGQGLVPAVTGRGSNGDQLWATFETAGKAKVEEAFLLYTVNGDLRSSDEEWFRAPATLASGRVEALAVPGMTHGIFCLVDANNFLIYSEPVPTMQDIGLFRALAFALEDGYAYKPGLVALIQCAESAQRHADQAGIDTSALKPALQKARTTNAKPLDEALYAQVIRKLRAEIRTLKNVPEAKLDSLNYYPLAHEREILSK